MEEGQTQNTQVTNQVPETPQQSNGNGVSFPTVGAPKQSGGPKTLLIIGILILVGILGFVIYKSASKKSSAIAEPTPFDNLTQPDQNASTVSTPTPAATPSVDKSTVTIQIQNGTGISGEAAYLQTQLKDLGYTNITVGNASETGLTSTKVTFSSTLDSGVVSEITQKLNSLYQNVTTDTSSSQTSGVVIITGLRKGSTPLPSDTPVDTATPADTSTPSANP